MYGRQGLTAGLELGPHLQSKEELKRVWEAFQAKQDKLKDEASTAHRGVYLCRLDASHTVDAIRNVAASLSLRELADDVVQGRGLARLCEVDLGHIHPPLFRQALVQNSIDAQASDVDVFHLQVRVRFGV